MQIDRTSAPRRSKAAPHRLGYYDLLIVDGDNLSPRRMARASPLSRFAASGRWVLAFDVRPAHFRRALRSQTGFWARRGAQKRRRVFLFRRTMVGGSPEVQMIEAARLVPRGSGRLSKRRRRRAATRGARHVVDILTAALHNKVPGRRAPRSTARSSRSLAASQGGAAIPPELQHIGWEFTQVGSEKLTSAYWNDKRGKDALIKVPPLGSQTASWTITHNFDVYLDNGEGHPQGKYQIVSYELSGEFSPKLPSEKFVQMYNRFKLGLGQREEYFLERAWWTGTFSDMVTPKITPSPGEKQLQFGGSQPETPNATTSYSSGNSFTVGFSASAEEGPGVNASYTVSNKESYSIPNWGVENQGSGNTLAWRFSARSSKEGACDARPEHYNEGGCFHNCFGLAPSCGNLPVLPSGLSLGQFQPHASAWWKTKSVLQGNTKLQFQVKKDIELEDSYCYAFSFGKCRGVWQTETGTRMDRHHVDSAHSFTVYEIEPGVVVPIPIKSLEFDHNPADGTERQSVTGTVELEKPAAMDTNVVIYSDSENAVVGSPINGGPGSRRTITIPKNQTQGKFTILTNDNKLSPGSHTTAAITAFYSEPTTEQLVIEAHRPCPREKGQPCSE